MESAEDQLARLGVQVEAMQALLMRLLQDAVRAEARLAQGEAGQIAAANEQLVLSAVSSQVETDMALVALKSVAQAMHRIS